MVTLTNQFHLSTSSTQSAVQETIPLSLHLPHASSSLLGQVEDCMNMYMYIYQ